MVRYFEEVWVYEVQHHPVGFTFVLFQTKRVTGFRAFTPADVHDAHKLLAKVSRNSILSNSLIHFRGWRCLLSST